MADQLSITGTLVKHLPLQTGVAKSGSGWAKRSFVLQPPRQYAKSFAVEAFGDKFDVLDSVAEGEELTVHFNIDGRAWTGNDGVEKWFTTISAWKIDVGVASSGGSTPKAQPAPQRQAAPAQTFNQSFNDDGTDLPF